MKKFENSKVGDFVYNSKIGKGTIAKVEEHRIITVHNKKVLEYLVAWEGFTAEQDTWEEAQYIKQAAPQVVNAWTGYQLRDQRIKNTEQRKRKRS